MDRHIQMLSQHQSTQTDQHNDNRWHKHLHHKHPTTATCNWPNMHNTMPQHINPITITTAISNKYWQLVTIDNNGVVIGVWQVGVWVEADVGIA